MRSWFIGHFGFLKILGGFGKGLCDFYVNSRCYRVGGHSFLPCASSTYRNRKHYRILYYGLRENKSKFHPKLASGEWKGCLLFN